MSLKIVYFGTPEFAAEILDFLVDQPVQVVGIVTQPDRPQGRSRKLGVSKVKEIACLKYSSVKLFQPEKASDPLFLESLQALNADLFVVVAYGQILSQKLLSIPPLGCINIHASLLPKYRGAAPIQRCLMNGDSQTGVCIQKMVKQLDAGAVIDSEIVEIPTDMTCGELFKKLCDVSKPLLLKVLSNFENNTVKYHEQDESLVTYAHKIEIEEGQIDFHNSALQLHNLIRAFSPKPGAWLWLEKDQKRLKILQSKVVKDVSAVPGQWIKSHKAIACKQDAIAFLLVQPEGKKVMTWDEWLRGQVQFSGF